MVVAFTAFPCFTKPLVKTISEIKAAIGKTIAKEMIPEKPYKAINPGFIINVAALVMEAAKDKPTTQAGKPKLPTA